MTKSGKETHGMGFFSSIYHKPLPGLCFLNLSLLEVETRTSYPLVAEQLVREEVKDSAPKAVKEKRAKRVRPKGSAHKNRQDVELSPIQAQMQGCIRAALKTEGEMRRKLNPVSAGTIVRRSGKVFIVAQHNKTS